MGNRDIEDSLDKLDKLTQEEARMASAELLKMVRAVDDRVQDIGRDVRGDVQDIDNKVQGVDDKVQGIGSDVKVLGSGIKNVSSEVRGVDNKLDQANRSLSLQLQLIGSHAQTASQGISSKIAFSDGSRLQIHLSIITSRPRLITRVQPNGFFKAVYSINGNPPAPFCGYMESVRLSLPSPCGDL